MPGALTRGAYFWPVAAKSSDDIESWLEIFQLQSYTICDSAELEEGYEKVAIYVDEYRLPTHVARQTYNGKWESKLGKGKDIQHDTLDLLEGNVADEYGTVSRILKRKLRTAAHSQD
ncbi:MAG TPA: hypothetical protein VFC63_15675 [Blastocatellia bacterium]|nr:hypothetical protein [Blastocatellia bacterium]